VVGFEVNQCADDGRDGRPGFALSFVDGCHSPPETLIVGCRVDDHELGDGYLGCAMAFDRVGELQFEGERIDVGLKALGLDVFAQKADEPMALVNTVVTAGSNPGRTAARAFAKERKSELLPETSGAAVTAS